jgi:hypothetical protein
MEYPGVPALAGEGLPGPRHSCREPLIRLMNVEKYCGYAVQSYVARSDVRESRFMKVEK